MESDCRKPASGPGRFTRSPTRQTTKQPTRPGTRETATLLGGWLAGWFLLARLPGPRPVPAGTRSRAVVSVVIPARNEEGNLGSLLDSLAHQEPAPAEVIVVDDRSTDATATVARRAGATVVTGTEPPAGWTGKCWACHQGAAAASGQRLVFLDADVTLAPDALRRLAAAHDRHGGLLSVAPFHHTERPYEKLSAVANVVALMGTGAFTPLPRTPLPRRAAMAFGPCLVTGADDYRAVGGHADPAVRAAVAEDVALARRFRAEGRPVAVLAGRDVVAYRMYPDGPGQLAGGWTRVLAAGVGHTSPPVAAAIGLWVTAGLLAASGPLRTRKSGGSALAWYGAFSLQMWWMFRRVGRFGVLGALAFPAPLSTFVALCARSVGQRLLGRSPTWRGRQMPGLSRPRS